MPTTEIVTQEIAPQPDSAKTVIQGNLSLKFLAACRTELEQAIGPIANFLIQEQLAQNPDLSTIEFIDALVEKIPDRTVAQEFRDRFFERI
jgi:serine/threonine-protein kinase